MNKEALHRRCLDCDYILDGLRENRCPECGRVFDPTDPSTFVVGQPRGRLFRAGTPFLIAAILALGMIGFGCLAYNSTDTLYRPGRAALIKSLHLGGVAVQLALLCIGALASVSKRLRRDAHFRASLKISGAVVGLYCALFLFLAITWGF